MAGDLLDGQELLESEITIMKKVHHENCIQFYESTACHFLTGHYFESLTFLRAVFDSNKKLYIVMELVGLPSVALTLL